MMHSVKWYIQYTNYTTFYTTPIEGEGARTGSQVKQLKTLFVKRCRWQLASLAAFFPEELRVAWRKSKIEHHSLATDWTQKMNTLFKKGPLPRYYQLKEIMREKIRTGEWKPGDLIPSERELGEQYGISRMTARQAITELVNEGLFYREQGKG